MAPTISIVLPTHNGERYLRTSIHSCLNQTYPNLELIIVDDCSTDSTSEIIREFAERDERVQTVRNASNLKLPNALNAGFAVARGNILTWTSDDNIYRLTALEDLLGVLQRQASVGLVYSDYTCIDESTNVLRSVRVEAAEHLIHFNVVGPCFAYRRAVQDKIGGYCPSLFLAEDWDYWLRIHSHFDLCPLHKDLYSYRLHANSLTETRSYEVTRMSEQILRRHLAGFQPLRSNIRAQKYVEMSSIALADGRRQDALKYSFEAIRCHPSTGLTRSKKIVAKILLGERISHSLQQAWLFRKKWKP